MQSPSPLVGELTDVVGDSLRCVAEYDRDGHEFRYVREDVDRRYIDEETEAIHHDLLLPNIGSGHVESLFDAGSLQCSALCFVEAHVLHFVRAESMGLFVSVDADAGGSIPEVVARCRQAIEAIV